MNPKWKRALRILRQGVRWRLSPADLCLRDLSEEDFEIIISVRPYTQTSPERLFAVINAARHIQQNGIQGAIVECGVWKGGSTMAAALALKAMGAMDRELYLFDTFSGMTAPTAKDSTKFEDGDPAGVYESRKAENGVVHWSFSPIEETRKNVLETGYDANHLHFIKGPVEQTIPGHAPEKIALLRLDTDFYESTKHELFHLFPRLVPGGVLIIDDYGHWEGARQAVDEYFRENKVQMLLNRVDYTGRIGVKSAAF